LIDDFLPLTPFSTCHTPQRPGKLLPDQQQLLDTQKARIDEQIRREQEELEDLQRTTEEAVQSLRSRIEKASADLATRKPKRNMVSPMEQADAGRSPVQHETTVETKEVDMDVEPETPTVADDAEVEY
jgi:capsule polysaccharide export protein KpsE/RkpR